MYPVLFTIFGYQISSFGIFLILAIIVSLFVLWRLAYLFELNQERILDLFFLTTIGAFLGARIWFVLFHLNQFNSLSKFFFLFKNPGLSFWGSFIGGSLVLWLLAPKLKLNFWQIADLSIVATFFAISIISAGCLFSGCQYGVLYDGWFAVHQFGLSGARFPLQIIEAGLFLLGFIYLWNAILRFHFNGRIIAVGLMILAVIKLILEPMRSDPTTRVLFFSVGTIMSLLFFISGVMVFYRQSKRSFYSDLMFSLSLMSNRQRRKLVVSKFKRNWYNFFIQSQISFKTWRKNMGKQWRVKSTPIKFRQ